MSSREFLLHSASLIAASAGASTSMTSATPPPRAGTGGTERAASVLTFSHRAPPAHSC
jgi:hypothetical protein